MAMQAAAFALPGGEYNIWLGEFGEAWFDTLCAAAACDPLTTKRDMRKVDKYVQDPAGEMIRVQIKTTEHPATVFGGYTFPLDVGAYNRLRVGDTLGYLVLVVVHRAHPKWTGHTVPGSVVRASAYVACLTGMPPTDNTATVNVSLPFVTLLTPARVLALFP